MQKEAKSLKKNDSTAAQGGAIGSRRGREKPRVSRWRSPQESQGARQTHPEGVRRNGQVRRESREAGTAIDKK